MSKEVNEMVFCIADYDDPSLFWKNMIDFIRILMDNQCVMTIEEEEKGVVIIHYDYYETCYGKNPYWLTEQEREKLMQL